MPQKNKEVRDLDDIETEEMVKKNIELQIQNEFLKKEREIHEAKLKQKLQEMEARKQNSTKKEDPVQIDRTNELLKQENELLSKKYEELFIKMRDMEHEQKMLNKQNNDLAQNQLNNQ